MRAADATPPTPAGPDPGPPAAPADADADAGTPASDSADPGGERLRRWRLVLGAEGGGDGTGQALDGADAGMDRTLAALYGSPDAPARGGGRRQAGLGGSAPQVARWLGDVRTYFPTPVVQVMQRDAIDRLGIASLLLEPEMLAAVEPDVHLVGTLLSLAKAMPDEARETARTVVRQVTDDLERKLAARTRATLTGALDRAARTRRPRHRDIDWDRTIRANLKHYVPEHRTVVPERLVGYARAARSVRKEVVLAIDQSGSMAASVVYASVFGAVLASMRSLATRLVAFDTAVIDLTDQLSDPVDVLFGTQLGGGTDINRALAYCQQRITRPSDTVVVLISDLYEGGIRQEMLKRVAAMKASGVQFVALLALSDEGAPAYDRDHAAALAALGAPAFACTPELFPDVMAAALEGRPLPAPTAA
ncbi:VWA domain-containing protein [Streptomyces synnematoformans]|uniref:VWA domain-containing protein n=1 Tax=Streptomyces synnematoformans TaxID=415721 RepID=A0ABN1ZUX2_9ACTN